MPYEAAADEAPKACEDIADWVEFQGAIQDSLPEKVEDRFHAEQREWALRQAAANRLFESYRKEKFNFAELLTCLSPSREKQNFLNSMSSVFLNRSLQILRGSRSPSIQKFVSLVDRKAGASGSIAVFSVISSHFHDQGAYRAGFHRAATSIFMNLDRIGPNEWLVVLIHEFLHSLDDDLWNALRIYNDPVKVKRIAAWANSGQSVQEIGEGSRGELEDWLLAGLSRGLLAEYRAWTATAALYQEGKKEGLWNAIDWLEGILAEAPTSQSVPQTIYSYLDQTFTDPVDGIFSIPKIQQALHLERLKLRNTDPLALTGALSDLVRPSE